MRVLIHARLHARMHTLGMFVSLVGAPAAQHNRPRGDARAPFGPPKMQRQHANNSCMGIPMTRWHHRQSDVTYEHARAHRRLSGIMKAYTYQHLNKVVQPTSIRAHEYLSFGAIVRPLCGGAPPSSPRSLAAWLFFPVRVSTGAVSSATSAPLAAGAGVHCQGSLQPVRQYKNVAGIPASMHIMLPMPLHAADVSACARACRLAFVPASCQAHAHNAGGPTQSGSRADRSHESHLTLRDAYDAHVAEHAAALNCRELVWFTCLPACRHVFSYLQQTRT